MSRVFRDFFCRNGRISPIVRGMAGKETTGRLPKARMGRKKRAVCQASGTGAGVQQRNRAARLAWATRAVKCGWSAGGRTLKPVDGRRQAAGGGSGSEAIGTRRGWVELPGSQNMGGLSGAWRRFRRATTQSTCGAVGLGLRAETGGLSAGGRSLGPAGGWRRFRQRGNRHTARLV